MRKASGGKRPLVFEENGFTGTLDQIKEEIQELYESDAVPWVIGYSGGKDSTAILQLVWLALQELPEDRRTKPVHVISTDTLVENPIVAAWVTNSLKAMEEAARDQGLPIVPHRLTPEVTNTFWVGLIGRGYPAPRLKFRWCTERLKIKPSNQFIRDVVQESGEAVLVLGTRKAESVKRATNMTKHGKNAVRERLTPNASLPNCLIYTPIEDWSNDDVWVFLMRVPNCWGHTNKDLLSMYRGASEDGECPLVVDTSTPSCGDSRFGCWVCTLVDKDKSMSAMIQNDREKEWMRPLLEFRNELDFRGERAKKQDRSRRDFRRITGKLTYFISTTGEDQLVHGPYNQETRAYWLRRLLEAQRQVHETGPKEVHDLELITPAELHEIRRTWVVDKHEIEDLLPQIYEEALGKPYDGPSIDENLIFDRRALDTLKQECDGGELQFEMARTLLNLERRYRTMGARRGLFHEMEGAIERCFFDNEADALERERSRAQPTAKDDAHPEIVAEANQPSLFDVDEEDAVA
jgi:DNA sulfur modification protein DndC